jgi:hypothetical protein
MTVGKENPAVLVTVHDQDSSPITPSSVLEGSRLTQVQLDLLDEPDSLEVA